MQLQEIVEMIQSGYPTDTLACILKDKGYYYDYGDYAEVFHIPSQNAIIKCNLYDAHEVKHEGEVISRLQGLPSIPKLLFYSKEVIIMEYINGISLSGYLNSNPIQTLQLNSLIFTMESCYQRGIEPVDVHSDNLLVTFSGLPVLVDFGLYRPYTGGVKVLPEFLKCGDIDERTRTLLKQEFIRYGYS